MPAHSFIALLGDGVDRELYTSCAFVAQLIETFAAHERIDAARAVDVFNRIHRIPDVAVQRHLKYVMEGVISSNPTMAANGLLDAGDHLQSLSFFDAAIALFQIARALEIDEPLYLR